MAIGKRDLTIAGDLKSGFRNLACTLCEQQVQRARGRFCIIPHRLRLPLKRLRYGCVGSAAEDGGDQVHRL